MILAPVSGRHGAYGDHSRKRPGPVTDNFSAARIVPTYLGLREKPLVGMELGKEPDKHDGPPAPGHINIILMKGTGILYNCILFRGIPNRLLHN